MTNVSQYPSREADQFNIRFSDGLRDRIKYAAKISGRSMNAEIVQRLEASFEAGASLSGDIAALIEQHIEAEVSARLRAIAAQIGGER